MKKFTKYMLKPMSIVSCVPSLGVLYYLITERKDLLAVSLILYFSVLIGFTIKYFYTTKPNKSKN